MTDGENSADDLSKSEDISVNRSIPDIIESPNFNDAYTAWRKLSFNLLFWKWKKIVGLA